jgi:H+/Cl- antiporter ClcA
MAGFFSAAGKVPDSTLVLVAELTGNLGMLVPGAGVCLGCYLLSGSVTLFPSQAPGPRTHRRSAAMFTARK